MNLQAGDVEEVKNLLQKSWYAGNRWLVYQDNPIVTAKSMVGFRTVNDANVHCENWNIDNHTFKFKSIGSVLSSIVETMGSMVKSPPNIRRLEMEIKQKSLLANSWDDDLVKSLQTGEIYPVIQQRVIDPQLLISSYKIWKQQEGPQTVSGLADPWPTEVASYRDYRQAVSHFQKIYKASTGASNNQPSYFLVGEFKGHELIMGNDGFPVKNTGLLLSMCRGDYSIGETVKPYCEIVVNDLNSAAVINEPVLAKYNRYTHKINLMDGHLKTVVPQKVSGYLEVEHFAFKRPIAVLPGPVQALWQEQKDVQTICATLRYRNSNHKHHI